MGGEKERAASGAKYKVKIWKGNKEDKILGGTA